MVDSTVEWSKLIKRINQNLFIMIIKYLPPPPRPTQLFLALLNI